MASHIKWYKRAHRALASGEEEYWDAVRLKLSPELQQKLREEFARHRSPAPPEQVEEFRKNIKPEPVPEPEPVSAPVKKEPPPKRKRKSSKSRVSKK